MDVTCERCDTEYEFDETLVSDRGTTVKCTQCGHLFRVFRPGAASTSLGPSAPVTRATVWRVRAKTGLVYSLNSLRELQARIKSGALTEEDEISRDDEIWKPLGTIAELAPFFDAARTAPAPIAEGEPRRVSGLPTQAQRPEQAVRTMHAVEAAGARGKQTMLGGPGPDRRLSERTMDAPGPMSGPMSKATIVGTNVGAVVAEDNFARAGSISETPTGRHRGDTMVDPHFPEEGSRLSGEITNARAPAASRMTRGAEAAEVKVTRTVPGAPDVGSGEVALGAKFRLDEREGPPANSLVPPPKGSKLPWVFAGFSTLVAAGALGGWWWTTQQANERRSSPDETVGQPTAASGPMAAVPVADPIAAAPIAAAPVAATPVAAAPVAAAPIAAAPVAAAPVAAPVIPTTAAEPPRTPAATNDSAGSPRTSTDTEAAPRGRDYGYYIREGNSLLDRGNVAKAEAMYEAALVVRPGGPEAQTGLGYVSLERGQKAFAANQFRRAAESGHSEAWAALGDVYRSLGRTDDAKRAYESYIERSPSGSEAGRARMWLRSLQDAPAAAPTPAASDLEQPSGGSPAPAPEGTTP